MDHYLVKSIRNKLKLETAHKKLPKPFHHGSLSADETIKIQFEYSASLIQYSNELICNISIFGEIDASVLMSEQARAYTSFIPRQAIIDPVKRELTIKPIGSCVNSDIGGCHGIL